MGLSVYLNKETLQSNFSDTLAKYDSDNNGFTKQEFSYALKNITSVFARNIIKLTRYDKKLFKEINTNKDDIVSYEELSNYIEKEYKLDFNKISNMTFKEICDEIDRIEKNKNNTNQ